MGEKEIERVAGELRHLVSCAIKGDNIDAVVNAILVEVRAAYAAGREEERKMLSEAVCKKLHTLDRLMQEHELKRDGTFRCFVNEAIELLTRPAQEPPHAHP